MPRKKNKQEQPMDPDAGMEAAMEAAGHEEIAVGADIDEVVSIEARIEALEVAVEEANNKALRTLADFQNYKKRALVDERLAREDGAASVLGGVITILDHFDLALGLDPETTTASAVLDGVRLIKNELLKSIGDQGVTTLEPQVGDEFDPTRHQATGMAPIEGVEPGHIAIVMQQGYAIGDRVVRPATVMIAPEAPAEQLDTEA
jgi:molecular chaperone GrpE